MNLSPILFFNWISVFNLNIMLISIEIMLLTITFLILVSSLSFDDILGQTYAIGLGILIAIYKLRGSIAIEYK